LSATATEIRSPRRLRRAAGYRWFNSLPAAQAVQCLLEAGLDATAAADLGRRRALTAVTHAELIGMLEGGRSVRDY